MVMSDVLPMVSRVCASGSPNTESSPAGRSSSVFSIPVKPPRMMVLNDFSNDIAEDMRLTASAATQISWRAGVMAASASSTVS